MQVSWGCALTSATLLDVRREHPVLCTRDLFTRQVPNTPEDTFSITISVGTYLVTQWFVQLGRTGYGHGSLLSEAWDNAFASAFPHTVPVPEVPWSLEAWQAFEADVVDLVNALPPSLSPFRNTRDCPHFLLEWRLSEGLWSVGTRLWSHGKKKEFGNRKLLTPTLVEGCRDTDFAFSYVLRDLRNELIVLTSQER